MCNKSVPLYTSTNIYITLSITQIKNNILDFDYFLCMNHNIVVELGNKEQHMDEFCTDSDNRSCMFLGQHYNIKKPASKISNDVSIKLVRGIQEKKNLKNWEKKNEIKLNKRKRDQDNYSKQLPLGDSILNLEATDF